MQVVEKKPLNLLSQGIFTPVEIVEKEWGTEFIIIKDELYCLKVMTLKPGKHCSEHMHAKKTETFLVTEGWMVLQTRLTYPGRENPDQNLDDWSYRILGPGESFRLPAKTWHIFLNYTDIPCKFLEVSTYDDPEDCFRAQKSGDVDSYSY